MTRYQKLVIMADYKNTIDFIKSVYGNQEFTPLAVPVFVGNEKKYLNECIDTTFVSSVGKFVDRFEEDMAKYTGAKKAVVCVSGTNALHMALQLVGVKKDDEVLTQALTFIATCNALSYIGAHAVFLDVDRSTMGLSPDAMKEWLRKNAEVRKNTRIGELDKLIRKMNLLATTRIPVAGSRLVCQCTLLVILYVLRSWLPSVRSGILNLLRMLQNQSVLHTKENTQVPSARSVSSASMVTKLSPLVVAV